MPVEIDIRKVLDTATTAAREAGALQKERLWSEHTLSYKGEVDLVTEVDRACEELIVNRISGVFPGHSFLAEENQYPEGDPGLRWIVDPLDGTTNYAHGFPWFCVSIAFEKEGEILAGVVYHCMMDELFSAAKGEGAFLNGRRILVSQRAPLRQSLIATGFPYDIARDNENNFENFIELQLAARGVRRAGAAALDLACVAAGRLDGYWECKLKPWDVAAGTLLVQEAGGKVTNHAGAPYSVYDHRILASNGAIHKEMLSILGRGAAR
ncbi:histidinol-phosphate phosphatase, putative [Citrifermentans bemidjiense Bem]|uniref:Inositol-1-monophosphatase n=1 Tax=Citrifermentans bemidjiense (strain ATCC BAA-1014 / DSM 16622 / JCM 12645 / Bem) TaxID=404380 RepID=B5E7Z2_CITBB|nr:inositol monophosphatase family protein [Citrifermentans bemidjiense]ACH38528.1 histidinol-phosphate phosphatase, putative [Citrifermentans bemidjiense Bem]